MHTCQQKVCGWPWNPCFRKVKGARAVVLPNVSEKCSLPSFICCAPLFHGRALRRSLGAASTVHDRFQQWVKAGVFYRLWESGLLQLHVEGVPDWQFQSIDGCQTKAPLGGEAAGANPTDRAKGGVKRHLLTQG